MRILNKIIKALGFVHDQKQALALPSEKRKAAPKLEALPDNIVTTKTGVFKVTTSEDSASWERVQSKKEASIEELTASDLQGLQDRKLNKDLIRAANFKRVWCRNISAAEATKITGLSIRTMEKYWAIFNKNQK